MKRITRCCFSTTLFAVLMLMGSGTARAVVLLDQEFWDLAHTGVAGVSYGPLSPTYGFGRSQTFTVGLAGTLDSIQVRLTAGSTLTSARILATSGGAPIGGISGSTVLATSSAVSVSGGTYTIDFSAASMSVNVGQVLAIELFGDSGWWEWPSGGYSGGSDYFFNVGFSVPNWTQTAGDNDFRTFVNAAAATVPEPGTLTLLGLGLGLAGLAATRRRKQ